MRITPRGIGMLGAAAGLLGAGFGLGYPELTVIGTTATIAMVFAVCYVFWRPQLSVVRNTDPDRVMRGDASQATLTVSNASRLRAATLIAHDRCGPRVVGVPLLRLRAGKETTVRYPVPTDRRGVVPIGPLQVVRRDPHGLFTMPRSHGGVDKVWVYPKAHPLSAVPPGVARSLDGLVDRVPHGTITFDTLREYVIGDELRHVHWRTTARIGELMVREHVDTSLPQLVILLDDRAVAYPDLHETTSASSAPASSPAAHAVSDAFEAVCEAATSILLAAVQAELPIALQVVSGATVPPSRRGGDTRPYLDLLAEVTPTEPEQGSTVEPLSGAATRLRHRRLGDTLIFITGCGTQHDLGEIAALRGAYPTLVVVLLGGTGPAPATLEGVSVLAASDGADFASVWDGVQTW
jgi:uncharacterized protein (DUF58 family)